MPKMFYMVFILSFFYLLTVVSTYYALKNEMKYLLIPGLVYDVFLIFVFVGCFYTAMRKFKGTLLNYIYIFAPVMLNFHQIGKIYQTLVTYNILSKETDK